MGWLARLCLTLLVSSSSYVFAKTTESGITRFYALFIESAQNTARFEYRPEGLDEGFRTLSLQDVNVADGEFHHIGVSVFGDTFALFIDGKLHSSRQRLIAALEDGPGMLFLGRRMGDQSRFAGTSDRESHLISNDLTRICIKG